MRVQFQTCEGRTVKCSPDVRHELVLGEELLAIDLACGATIRHQGPGGPALLDLDLFVKDLRVVAFVQRGPCVLRMTIRGNSLEADHIWEFGVTGFTWSEPNAPGPIVLTLHASALTLPE
jgi:hypothetical protein